MLRHASLFSGIGGFDLAASLTGWENIFSCEKNPFCRQVLDYYWPKTRHYEDIFELQATQYLGKIDVLTGGFPCQPFSQSGQRKGIQDERYLFPETCRIIRECKPTWIVLENVTGLFTILEPDSLSQMEIKAIELFCKDDRQPTSKTIIRLQRRVIGSIIAEIGKAGYVLPRLIDGTPIVLCIPAAAVGAPHQRDRVWFVAHTNSNSNEQSGKNIKESERETEAERSKQQNGNGGTGFADGLFDLPFADSSFSFRKGTESYSSDTQKIYTGSTDQGADCGNKIPSWEQWPSVPPFFSGINGISDQLDGISFSVWQQESTRAYGNAIVPKIAFEIFKVIGRLMSRDFIP